MAMLANYCQTDLNVSDDKFATIMYFTTPFRLWSNNLIDLLIVSNKLSDVVVTSIKIAHLRQERQISKFIFSEVRPIIFKSHSITIMKDLVCNLSINLN